MAERSGWTCQIRTFAPDDQRRLLEETIREWRARGPQAIWRASFDMLDYWFAIRGLNPEEQRIDRSRVGIEPVPWRARAEKGGV